MSHSPRFIAQAALLAALYLTLTHLQNFILPGSASLAIQCRLSEALCVLAYLTPAAVPGLTVGCLVFNLTFAGALPLDLVVGPLATLLAAQGMYLLRRSPWGRAVGLALPALCNGILVGWELSLFLGEGSFWINAGYVALGEGIVLVGLGVPLLRLLRRPDLRRLFS